MNNLQNGQLLIMLPESDYRTGVTMLPRNGVGVRISQQRRQVDSLYFNVIPTVSSLARRCAAVPAGLTDYTLVHLIRTYCEKFLFTLISFSSISYLTAMQIICFDNIITKVD